MQTYSITNGQADTLVELARGGQDVAAVVPLANQAPNVLAHLVDRLPDGLPTRVRRSDLTIEFPGAEGRVRVTHDLRGYTVHAVAVAAPWEDIMPATAVGPGQVLGP